MAKHFAATLISLIAVSIFAPVIAAAQNVARQPGAVYDFDRPDEKPAPAPKRDISGVWEPARGPGAGIQGKGRAVDGLLRIQGGRSSLYWLRLRPQGTCT